MEESSSARPSRKRQASRKSEEPTSQSKKQKSTYNQVTVNLNERIAKAMEDVLVTTHNESFREKCLNTLGAANGSEAGKIIEDLIVKFKDNKKQKAIKENSKKINENSP